MRWILLALFVGVQCVGVRAQVTVTPQCRFQDMCFRTWNERGYPTKGHDTIQVYGEWIYLPDKKMMAAEIKIGVQFRAPYKPPQTEVYLERKGKRFALRYDHESEWLNYEDRDSRGPEGCYMVDASKWIETFSSPYDSDGEFYVVAGSKRWRIMNGALEWGYLRMIGEDLTGTSSK